MRVFCPHGPLRKYFRSVFSARTDHYENIFEAETWRNPRENFPPLLLNLLRNVFTLRPSIKLPGYGTFQSPGVRIFASPGASDVFGRGYGSLNPVSDDPRHFIFRRFFFAIFLQTLKVRLPPEDGSDWPGTWSKRVSDDPQHFIFRPLNPKIFWIFGR